MSHYHKHDHDLEPGVLAVETVDHPCDGQLLKYARRYFKAAGRMIQGPNPVAG